LSDRTRITLGTAPALFCGGHGLSDRLPYLAGEHHDYAFFLANVIVLQLASNTIQGPWQALIPSRFPMSNAAWPRA